MRILLDTSPDGIRRMDEKWGFDFWQLRTPLTGYRLSGKPYALDNGCFTEFKKTKWLQQVEQAKINQPLFVTLPDIVGDAVRTLDLFDAFHDVTRGVPRALVLQDGIGKHRIPWNSISAVFIGGSDHFKIAPEAINAAKTAKMLGKWVHVGRVNTPERVSNWLGLADSIDGTGILKYDHMMTKVLDIIRGECPQQQVIGL